MLLPEPAILNARSKGALVKPLRWSIVLVALTAVFPCSGERRPSMSATDGERRPGPASTEGDDRPGGDREKSQALLDELDQLGKLSLEEAWPAVERMTASFKKAPAETTRALHERVESLSGRSKLLAAELLTSRREDTLYQRGQLALIQIARDDADKEARIGALRLLADKSYSEAVYLALGDLTRMEDDPEVLIEACLALWGLENRRSALRPVFQMLSGDDLELQYKATLALAEIGFDHLPIDEVVGALEMRRPDLHIIVTGRNAKPELIEAADMVTDMTMVKHHFRDDVKAQVGIEF